MRNRKLVAVYTVVVDEDPGWEGNGDRVYWFSASDSKLAAAFAAKHTHYGQPATAHKREVPRHVAERHGCI